MQRPLAVLIAALGGEGGGVLSNWLVAAAGAEGFLVQSTSIPGVAQRTGATTYYLELFPVPVAELGGREPVMSLTPSPSNLDLVVTSELLEAGRAMERGLVTPERTTLIASTHRVYSITEKAAMADGRYEGERVVAAAAEMAKRAILFDMAAVAAESGSVISAVMLGAIAGSELLPIRREAYEAAIREAGIAVESNLAGFAGGFSAARGGATPRAAERAPAAGEPSLGGLARRIKGDYPAEARAIVELGAARVLDYQDEAYAHLYLEHLDSLAAVDRSIGGAERGYGLTKACARYLALWMAYEDVVRVADLKTRASRLERVRAEVGAEAGEPVRVTEYLKPGLDEITALLPRWIAAPLRWLARRAALEDRLNVSLFVRSTSVSGYLVLWLLSKGKRWRRRSSRYAEEQALIAHWLDVVDRATRIDYDFALEVVELARLIKGYGDTHRRGLANFTTVMERVVAPALASGVPAAAAVARAREAALADAEGKTLERTVEELVQTAAAESEAPPRAVAGD